MKATKILGTALLFTGLVLAPAAAADLWLHVKVDGGRNGEQATINLPLSLVDTFAPMISRGAHGSGRVRIDDRDYSVSDLRRIWRQIENGPDATYVTVEEPGSRVRIAKRGDYLVMEAVERNDRERVEQVEARVPLTVMKALLSGPGDELNVGAALEALAREGEGELVTVNGRDETVRIWVDAVSDAR
ncbi:MAG TPA: hypothetical protein VGG03_09415 [Thermoanaerobaculia bacterium]